MTPVSVEEIGSFFVGGRTVSVGGLEPLTVRFTTTAPFVVEQNGDFDAFQMYVQYVKLAKPRAAFPLCLWHGGALTGATWEHTPDGRAGWQTFFLRAGHDVYVSDAVERGRSSWARYPQIYSSPPVFRPKREAWELFRIGPAYAAEPHERVAFEGTQFPIEAFDTFTKSIVPRWVGNDGPTLDAYGALLERLGAATIVAHSQGAGFALDAALAHPARVKAVVAVEPSSIPCASAASMRTLRATRHLFVWGDYVERHPFWNAAASRCRAYHDALRDAGVDSTFVELPTVDVTGNSHMLMADRNSDRIAGMIQRWFEQRELVASA